MAVAQVHQREIVEVPFTLPDGRILPHPALVLSCASLSLTMWLTVSLQTLLMEIGMTEIDINV